MKSRRFALILFFATLTALLPCPVGAGETRDSSPQDGQSVSETRLRDAFILEEVGSDEFGLIYEKRNSPGSTVMGTTAEIRANYNRKAQI